MNDPHQVHWRSLDEFADPQLAERRAEAEFEDTPLRHDEAPGRRDFLRATGFVLAGSAITGCSRAPVRTATPLPTQPEDFWPGRSDQYATICTACPASCGVLAKVRDGRPVKLEGNPDHPVSRGGLCAVGQASILSLYDSHRLGQPQAAGKPASWEETDRAILTALDSIRKQKGAVRILTGTVTSPSLQERIRAFAATFENARHVVFDPLSSSAILDAHEALFGTRVLPRMRFEKAPVVAAFEADFLGTWISPAEFTRGYREARLENGKPSAHAWHTHFESHLSLTGGGAEERVRLAPGHIAHALAALVSRLASRAGAKPPALTAPAGVLPEKELDALAARLWNARGRSLVVCGLADVKAQKLCAFANQLLGNYGTTLDLERPSMQRQGSDRAMAGLLQEISAGQVAALFVHGLNPVAELPLDKPALDALRRIPLLVSLSSRADETAELARFVCPDADPLESWGDAEPVSGTVCIQQPVFRQVGHSRPAMESLAAWSGKPATTRDQVRAYWRDSIHPRHGGGQPFEEFWRASLQAGAAEVKPLSRAAGAFRQEAVEALPVPKTDGMTAVLYAKTAILDGRHAYNPWLQELPDPISKAAWDNYACVSPAKAAALGLADGDLIKITAAGHSIELPVLIQAGQHDDAVAIALGYGRRASQRFANPGPKWLYARPTTGADGLVGVNASCLLQWTPESLAYQRAGVQIEKTGRNRELAVTQTHHSLTMPPKLDPGGPPRPIVQEVSLDSLSAPPEHKDEAHPELWPRDHKYTGHRWAMAIDLDACSGCSACVVSCQIENNVPVAGRDEVIRNREMHWLRIDRYYSGTPENPRVAHQPMMCQHCEHAPCETVCPVLATVHSSEGLNQQIYNRCVGTRYCANNCPYKVRRFNWFDYPHEDRLVNLVLNPDVTVRSRGVMEKCSFCVQRIQEAKIEAKRLGKPVADGDVAPACQQSCPAQAIVFGDLNDPKSQVSQWAAQPRGYRVLEEINVRPSVYYLKVIRRDGEANGGGQHG
ncbi:MAG: Fe-S-cluster-containing hydrogenase [Bryobacterales bacterium]|nr:Fe-S-cluster-containing hydrogenase [Bryobacterales bacterium]